MQEPLYYIKAVKNYFVDATMGRAKLWKAFFIPLAIVMVITTIFQQAMVGDNFEDFIGSPEHIAFRYALLPVIFWWCWVIIRCSKNTSRLVWTWTARIYAGFLVFRSLVFVYVTLFK